MSEDMIATSGDLRVPEAPVKFHELSFVGACIQVFGKQEGKTTKDFLDEIKALTPEDRAYYIDLFRTVRIDATKGA